MGNSLVDSTKKSRQAYIAKLSEENRIFYGSPDGLGLLNVIELSFDGRWVYLFELVQNALDAGANSISVQVVEAGDVLVFQHNGTRSLEEKDVEGLSKVFRSTKGARSVGFMGIGFKSVFMRFQEARVSGWDWKFRYEIAQEEGEEYGDIQRQFLGAVVPMWDDAITPPGHGYTTRFELRRRTEEDKALASDMSHLLPDEDRAPLAILAMSGLERLEINGQIWELGAVRESEGNYEVAALSDDENLLWRVFEVEFRPSKAAIACFLEHRKIKPGREDRGRVYAEATRPRRVLGVLPLDNEGMPEEIATATDGEVLKGVSSRLAVPTLDNRRVKLDRLVKRSGGRLRGALGGWVVPLDRIEEALRAELTHPDFPWDIPETTTGSQALGYILHVWGRARSSPDGLANEVRDVLPTAYAYCLDDSATDHRLLERWQSGLLQAMVFADREWLDLADTMDVYLDDIDDRRFLPRQGEFRTVTGGHLGRSRVEQLRVAESIGLRTLSSCVTRDWRSDEPVQVPAVWESRFDLVYQLVRGVRGGESTDDDSEDFGVVAQSRPDLVHVGELHLGVRIGEAPVEVVPVNARLHEGSLTVAGRPLQFGADAAKELLRDFSFGQRAGLAADLTGMLTAIDDDDFSLAAEKFRRSHAPALVLPGALETGAVASGSGDSKSVADEGRENLPQDFDGGTQGDVQGGGASTSGGDDVVDSPTSGGELADEVNDGGGEESEDEDSGSLGGSYGKDRAMAKQNALARELRRSLKGEMVPDLTEDDTGEDSMTNETDGDEVRLLGDEEYREAAAQYERDAGREPELGDPLQAGWDIRSTDPETQQVRLIEVKGRGRPWDGDEVVELSGAQIRKAFETENAWYLYVVEKTDEGRHQVLPIENPVRLAGKWILCGESWRMVAESSEGFGDGAESVGGAEN